MALVNMSSIELVPLSEYRNVTRTCAIDSPSLSEVIRDIRQKLEPSG
jgi:hypothetical protein